MSSLINTKIQDTYTGLIKTADNLPIDGTLKTLQDGNGGNLPIQISNSTVNFTGTVTGIDGAGLVAGTATDSMKNSDALVTNPATSSGPQSIALGNGAVANNNQSIAIGNYAESTSIGSAAVGEYASANGIYSSAWGRTSYARADGSVAFGQQAGVPVGVNGAVAMGRQVVADLADTTHVRALKIVAPDGGTGGNGITLLSPNGTAGVVTLTDASQLAVDGTPIGGGGASKYANSSVAIVQELGPSTADTVMINLLIPGGTLAAGDIVNIKGMLKFDFTGGGTNYSALALNTSTSYDPTKAFASTFSGSDQAIFYDRTLVVNTVDGTGLGTTMMMTDGPIDQHLNGKYPFPDGVNGLAINWSVDQYLQITGFAEGTGSYIETRMLTIAKIN